MTGKGELISITALWLRNFTIAILLLMGLSGCSDHDNELSAEDGEALSGGEFLTTYDFSENAFGQEANNLSSAQETDFVVGNSLFRSNWVTAPSSVKSLDGLGPMFNSNSCSGCHFKDGRAAPPLTENEALDGLLFRLSIAGTGNHGAPLEDPNYGGQLSDNAILGVDPEATVNVTYQETAGQYADGTTYSLRTPHYEFVNLNYGDFDPSIMFSPRIAQQIPGLGLLELVPEATILAFADEQDRDGDGISGKPNYVWDEINQKVSLGRFGWKANVATIAQQAAGAISGDMGITSSIFPNQNLTASQHAMYDALPNGGEPEIGDKELNRIILYVQTLSVPARRSVEEQDILHGKSIFNQLQCSACHVAKMTTGSSKDINQLSNQVIRPYTDLLVHDMGEGLADHRPDFEASGTEWRTAPLWGIGMVKTVNKHTYFLHDGRARNLEEAVLWHGGEAQKAVDSFKNLSKTDRDILIKFLESL